MTMIFVIFTSHATGWCKAHDTKHQGMARLTVRLSSSSLRSLVLNKQIPSDSPSLYLALLI